MNIRRLIQTGLVFLVTLAAIQADEFLPFTHDPAAFQKWGVPINGVTAGTLVQPLASINSWSQGYRVQVMLKNDSAQTYYIISLGGHHGPCQLSILDGAGKPHQLREKLQDKDVTRSPGMPLGAGKTYLTLAFIQQDEMAEILGNAATISRKGTCGDGDNRSISDLPLGAAT